MNGPGVLALQLIDNELDRVAGVERRLPERATLTQVESAHRAWSAERAAQAAAAEDASARIVRSEQESAAIDTKRARLEQQLKTVIAPREAEALMHQIDGLKAQRSDLDDAELLAMEEQSDAEMAMAALDEREPQLLADVAAAREALDAALGSVAGERDELTARRATAVAALDDADVRAYESLRTRFGGVGIVQIDARRCTGCNLDLTAGELDEVRSAPADELPECPHCGRLIVR